MRRNEIQEIRAGVDNFQEEKKGELLAAAKQAATTLLTGQQALLKNREDARTDAKDELERLQLQRRGMGGDQLEALEVAQKQAEQEAQDRESKRSKARQACVVLGVTLPDSPQRHAELVSWARSELDAAADGGSGDNELRGKLAVEEAGLVIKHDEAQTALATLARLPGSNIPHHLIDLRYRMATALRVAEDDLPFVGELIEVEESEKGWQGAIERVLRGTALSMLVDETLHPQVSRHVDATDLKGRLVYIRTLPQSAPPAPPKSTSLVHKVTVAEGPFRQWLHAELRQRFNIECVETSDDLRSVTNGVTRNGLAKQGGRRHKDVAGRTSTTGATGCWAPIPRRRPPSCRMNWRRMTSNCGRCARRLRRSTIGGGVRPAGSRPDSCRSGLERHRRSDSSRPSAPVRETGAGTPRCQPRSR